MPVRLNVSQEDHRKSHHDLAYTANHSTETALLKVTNDIFMALDKRHCVFLVLLDLSAAFDTIDHDMFLQRLATEYAIIGRSSHMDAIIPCK